MNKKCIVVTGTPGTGKTTVAKRLSEVLGYEYLDVTKLIKDKGLSSGFDKEKDCEIVDIEKLNSAIIEVIDSSEKTVIVDSHMGHELDKPLVKLCVVTKCELKVLEERLKERGYSHEKIKENLTCEIFDVCCVDAKERGHKLFIVDTSSDVDYDNLIAEIKK